MRRLPVGAEVLPGGGVHFRVWAPRSPTCAVEWWRPRRGRGAGRDEAPTVAPLSPEPGGYFAGTVPEAEAGVRYKFRLATGAFPDPASRFQPEGPHGPSEVIDPGAFAWQDAGWQGVSVEGQILYELHVGTFTRAGTWTAAAERLPELADLGVTILEVMPVADFPGRFGWGYDGVNLYAPTRLYGGPDDFRRFVDRAHACGLGVILDVVYNHLGPDGNYLKQFAPNYFSDRHCTEWGEAINFDGPENGPVREFFTANAGYWIAEYHLDGLRLDATQQIFDDSPEHILTAVGRAVREAARGRGTFVVAENETQHTRLVRPPLEGGYGLDAVWNDDFHHSSIVALTGRNEAYYGDYRGAPQELVSELKYGFLYQGQRYKWQGKRRGTPTFGLPPWRFVSFIQNHDQVANSLRGLRLHQLTSPGRYRAMTAVLLLGPATPMLFQGQEFAASAPFQYFADHNPELARLVAQGREEYLRQFPRFAAPECHGLFMNPESPATFELCKLDDAEREEQGTIYRMHRDLIRLRRTDPVFARPRAGGLDGAVVGPEAFVLRFFGGTAGDRLLVVNLGLDLHLDPAPEPLLAPPAEGAWTVRWSSEDPRYGGSGTPPVETEENWRLPGQAAVVLFPESLSANSHGDRQVRSQNRPDPSHG